MYIGYYKNGIRDGKGIYKIEEGEIYKGSWKNDKRNGFGMLYKDNKIK